MQGELLRTINVGSNSRGQIIIIYSAFVKYLRKSGDSMSQDIIYQLRFIYEEALYKFFIEFGISMKLGRLTNLHLTETYSRFRVGKNLSGIFPIRNVSKKGVALLPLLFDFTLKYAIRRVQVKKDGMKLNC